VAVSSQCHPRNALGKFNGFPHLVSPEFFFVKIQALESPGK